MSARVSASGRVTRPAAPGCAAVPGVEAEPVRVGQPERQRPLAHPRSVRRDRVSHCGSAGDDRPGVPGHPSGSLQVLGERDRLATGVVGAGGPVLAGRQQPAGQVADVDHLGRQVRRIRAPGPSRRPRPAGRTAAASNRCGRTGHQARRSGRPGRSGSDPARTSARPAARRRPWPRRSSPCSPSRRRPAARAAERSRPDRSCGGRRTRCRGDEDEEPAPARACGRRAHLAGLPGHVDDQVPVLCRDRGVRAGLGPVRPDQAYAIRNRS